MSATYESGSSAIVKQAASRTEVVCGVNLVVGGGLLGLLVVSNLDEAREAKRYSLLGVHLGCQLAPNRQVQCKSRRSDIS